MCVQSRPQAQQAPVGCDRSTHEKSIDLISANRLMFSGGWFPSFPPGEAGYGAIKQVQDYALEAGRDPASIGIEGRINIGPDTGPEDWVTEVKAWEEMGASHLAVGVRGARPISPDQHIDGIRKFHEAIVR